MKDFALILYDSLEGICNYKQEIYELTILITNEVVKVLIINLLTLSIQQLTYHAFKFNYFI